MGKDAVAALRAIADGRWVGSESARDVAGVLGRVTGFGIRCHEGRQTVVRLATGEGIDPAGDDGIARETRDAMRRHLLHGDAPAGRRVVLDAGARELLDRAGIRLAPLLDIHRALHHLALATPDGFISSRVDGARLVVEYRSRQGASWNAGVVTARIGELPGSLRCSIAGRTMSDVVPDAVLSPLVIRTVGARGRDGLTRIVTEDAGRVSFA